MKNVVGRHSPQHARRPRFGGAEDEGASEDRLRALSARLPSLRVDTGPLGRRRGGGAVVRGLLVVVLVAVVVLAGVEWFRPIPSPALHATDTRTVRLAGAAPALPWPTGASGALAVDGGPQLGTGGSQSPAPIAGLAKVMTAYVALADHPLTPGASGPAIDVTSDAVAAYQAEAGSGQSAVPLSAGESLTELQVLQGLLVASGNDMATLLADWDAGGTQAFVAKMNHAARVLGMRSTTFTDPVGLDSGTVSTPSDLVLLGEAAMKLAVLRQVVAMTEVTLPQASRVFNLDADIGHDGFIGIKTGSDSVAGGCFLFAAQQTVAGVSVTLVGDVIGEHTSTQTASALSDASALVSAALADAGARPALPKGTTVGEVTAPWGAHVPVVVADPPTVVGWPGEVVPVRITRWPIGSSFSAGTRVGTLALELGGRPVSTPLAAAHALPGPGVWWRLTRR